MITPAGTKQPMAVGDLARKTHLEVPLVFGCLARLVPLGFVRRVDPGDDGPAEHQVWEVAHDFLASLLSRILPGWKPSLARRLLPWLGPAVLAAGIGGILVLTALSLAIDPVENWARHFGGIAVRRDDGGYAVQFHDIDRLRGCLAALAPRDAGSVRELEFDFIPREVNAGGLAQFSDELSNIDKLSNLSTFTLREKLSDLSPSTLRKVGPVKLPPGFGRLRSLTTLNLTGGALSSPPSVIFDIETLSTLNLSGNKFTHLPPEINRLRSLTTLDLTDSDLTSLPAEFGALQQLSTLILDGNGFTRLPEAVLQLGSLTHLSLHDNGLRELPADIRRLRSLGSLNASYNRLTRLPAAIGDLQGLTSLDLDDNRLEVLPQEIERLHALKRTPSPHEQSDGRADSRLPNSGISRASSSATTASRPSRRGSASSRPWSTSACTGMMS